MENMIGIPVEEFVRLVRKECKLEELELIASDKSIPSYRKEELIAYALGIKKEDTNA